MGSDNILLFTVSSGDKKNVRRQMPTVARSIKTQFTFKDCVDLYHKRHVSKLKRSTQQGLKAKNKYFYKSPLRDLFMKDLCAQKIDLWLEWLKSLGTAKNRNSFRRELNILCSILNWYHNYVDETFIVPVMKRHKVLCEYKPSKPRRVDYFARPEELYRWILYLKKFKKDPVYWRLAQFMVLTGCRVGEATALLWSDFNSKHKTIDITKTLGWDYHTKEPYVHPTPKTPSSIRRIYLPDMLVEILQDMKQQGSPQAQDIIFYTKEKKVLKYNMIQCHFNTAFKACNLPWRSTHICRHSYATMALMATKNLTAVQACLGHTHSRATERYAKIMALVSTDIAEDIATFWNTHCG